MTPADLVVAMIVDALRQKSEHVVIDLYKGPVLVIRLEAAERIVQDIMRACETDVPKPTH